MERLRAKRPILYGGRMYREGEALPVYDPAMVRAWTEAGSAAWAEEKPKKAEEGAVSAPAAAQERREAGAEGKDTGKEKSASASGKGDVTASLTADSLNGMDKKQLEKLAAELGVALPRGATKALMVEKLSGRAAEEARR